MALALLSPVLADVASADPVVLSIGEVFDKPVSATVDIPPKTPKVREPAGSLVVKSAVQREVTLYAFGKNACVGGAQCRSSHEATVRPDAPLDLRVRAWNGPVVVVAVGEDVEPTEHDLYGLPKEIKTLDDRALEPHLLAARFHSPFRDDHSHRSAELVARLFLTLDKQFVVYTTVPQIRAELRTGNWRSWPCGFEAGEPVLILDAKTPLPNGSPAGIVLRATGQRCRLDGPLANAVTATPPAQLNLPPPTLPPVNQSLNRWKDEEFIRFAADNPRIARYKTAKDAAKQCSDKMWDKLDPNARSGAYDVVSYDARGKVKKVEGLAARQQREVDAACKLTRLFRERDEIRASLANTYTKEVEQRLAEIATRLRE